MYARRCEEIARLQNNHDMFSDVDDFFGVAENETMYVFEGSILFGIITRIDYNKNRGNGKLINTEFKRLLLQENKTEEMVTREAEELFSLYKNIGELPVVNEAGELQYVLKREGEPSDVFPYRFCELYGGNERLAKYISELGEGRKKISTDSPEILCDYLKNYMDEDEYEICFAQYEAPYNAEKIVEEYELEVFSERVKENASNFFFMRLPYAEELTTLQEEELERCGKAEKKTMQFYLQNYSYDEEIQKLAHCVLGSDANQEFVDAQKVVASFVVKGGLCYNTDKKSKYVNVVNGRRVTTDVPLSPDGEVYLFGPCTMFGVIVEDKYTIPSCLQRVLNGKGINREVMNEGMVGAPLIEEIRKFNRTSYREDAVFVFMVRPGAEEEGLKKYLPKYPIYSMKECFDSFKFHNYFFDIPKHCNKRACEKIAEYVMENIEDIINVAVNQGRSMSAPAIDSKTIVFPKKELAGYQEELQTYFRTGENGAIVMNCNPFTNGHLYLIKQASSQVDNLYIFIVSENKSVFSFEDRIRLVKEGIKNQVSNAIVIPSGKFILSSDTFPEYFTKESATDEVFVDTSFDIELFSKYIAPVLNIKVRFVGEEPKDIVTRQYNRDMKRILPQYGIECVCMERKKVDDGTWISASDVRKFWMEGNKEEVRRRVPKSTYDYLFK